MPIRVGYRSVGRTVDNRGPPNLSISDRSMTGSMKPPCISTACVTCIDRCGCIPLHLSCNTSSNHDRGKWARRRLPSAFRCKRAPQAPRPPQRTPNDHPTNGGDAVKHLPVRGGQVAARLAQPNCLTHHTLLERRSTESCSTIRRTASSRDQVKSAIRDGGKASSKSKANSASVICSTATNSLFHPGNRKFGFT
jgi:hypothetical protein